MYFPLDSCNVQTKVLDVSNGEESSGIPRSIPEEALDADDHRFWRSISRWVRAS